MEFKRKACREEMFDADEYAVDWKTHQQFRIERIKAIRSVQIGTPAEKLKLAYRDKHRLELMNRKGETLRYRPEGIILRIDQSADRLGMMEFEVAWVDPWGFPHTAERTFLDIQINPVDEISYMRLARNYREAKVKHWVPGLS